MNENNKFRTVAEVVMIFLTIVGLGITWYSNRHKSTILEIKTISDLELTRPLNVEHLSSTYFYDDSIPVQHLWQSSFVITNIGENILFGNGFESKTIKEDALLFQLKNCERVLSIEIIDNNADVSLQNSSIHFSQWRPNEYVELRIISDGPTAPELLINERDIKEGQVVYTKYSPEEKPVVKRWVDYLPLSLYKALWWVVIIFEVLLLLFLMITGIQQYIKTEDKVTRISTAFVKKHIAVIIGVIN